MPVQKAQNLHISPFAGIMHMVQGFILTKYADPAVCIFVPLTEAERYYLK